MYFLLILCRFETKRVPLKMKRIFYVLAICIIANLYSCKQKDAGTSNSSANDEATKNAKKDSTLKAADKLLSGDSLDSKKDSLKKKK